MKQPLLLMDRYPAPPDGAAEIEREAMTRAHVLFAVRKLTDEAVHRLHAG
jgi:hypothetical protein